MSKTFPYLGMLVFGAEVDLSKTKIILFKLIPQHKIKTATTLGFIFAILSASFSALPDVISKPMVDPTIDGITPIDPLMLVLIMYLMTGLFFSPIAKLQKPVAKVKKSILFFLIIYGIIGAAATISFSIGLKESSAINASILANSETIFVIFIGIIILKERLLKKEIGPFVLVMMGAILFPIVSDIFENELPFSQFVFGDALIIISGFLYCLCTFISKHVSKTIKTAKIVQMMSLSGALFTFILMILFQTPFTINISNFSIISFVGIVGIGGSVLFYVVALKLIGAVRTVLIFSSTTIFGVIYSILYLSEPINLFNISSLATVMIGLFYLRSRLANQ